MKDKYFKEFEKRYDALIKKQDAKLKESQEARDKVKAEIEKFEKLIDQEQESDDVVIYELKLKHFQEKEAELEREYHTIEQTPLLSESENLSLTQEVRRAAKETGEEYQKEMQKHGLEILKIARECREMGKLFEKLLRDIRVNCFKHDEIYIRDDGSKTASMDPIHMFSDTLTNASKIARMLGVDDGSNVNNSNNILRWRKI